MDSLQTKELARRRAPESSHRAISAVTAIGIAIGAALSADTASAQSAARTVAPAEWARIVAAARKEGKVVVYTTTAPAVSARIKADFDKAFPDIPMEPVRLIGAQINSKVELERQVGNVDGGDTIITSELLWSVDATKKGWLKVPVGPAAAAWPEAFIKQGAVPLLGVNPFVLVYNTKLVKTPPTSYQDLLKPEFKGKIGASALVGDPVVGWYDWQERTQGAGWLAKLAAQNVKMYPGAVGPTQAVASGELIVNMWTVFSVTNPMLEVGAPIKTVVVNPSYGAAYGGGVIAGSKRPNAALVFMDYMMSVRGQAQMVGNGEMASALPGVPGSLDVSTVTLHDSEKYPAEVVNAFTTKWNALFQQR